MLKEHLNIFLKQVAKEKLTVVLGHSDKVNTKFVSDVAEAYSKNSNETVVFFL